MRRALLSVTDKQGIVEFARGLADAGFGLLSTGGTARTLADAGVATTEVADYTGFPELMDGRLKTLHPKVHGGLLGRRDDDGHRAAMAAHQIDPIDVLCVNLYRFRETLKKPGISRQEIVEQIDIGGPAMIRSAAKNHHAVAVVVDPADYPTVLRSLRDHGGTLPAELLRKLAAKAFAHTAAYDAAIAQWFDCERRASPGEQFFAGRVAFSGEKLQDLRYGENPHQKAAFYTLGEPSPSLANSKQLGGKELSYNNILDADAALALALEFDQTACVLVKHNNPCGAAVASGLPRAFELALSGDPVSAFGGILATNRTFDVATAQAIVAERHVPRGDRRTPRRAGRDLGTAAGQVGAERARARSRRGCRIWRCGIVSSRGRCPAASCCRPPTSRPSRRVMTSPPSARRAMPSAPRWRSPGRCASTSSPMRSCWRSGKTTVPAARSGSVPGR